MTINEDILDRYVRHLHWLERYKTGETTRIVALLDKADKDLVQRIEDRLDRIGRGDILSKAETERLKALLKEIRDAKAEASIAVYDEARQALEEFAAYEADFKAKAIEGAVVAAQGTVDLSRPSASQLRAVVTARPFQGRLLREWYENLGETQGRRITDAIRIGITQGQTNDEIVRRIRGTRALRFKDGILEMGRRDAAAVVRTAVAHVANKASEQLYAENEDIIEGVQWVSTLDSRTSSVCRARDGEIYPVGKGPRPPAHWNCLPQGSLVTTCDRITAASERWFDGYLVTIRTAGGYELSCTPNHPVLTNRGWVAAKSLDLGSKILRYIPIEGPSSVHGDGNNVPSRIEDVAKAFLGSAEVLTVPVPASAEDFHGDGVDGQIAIVGADGRLLLERAYAQRAQHCKKLVFVMRAMASAFRLGGFRHAASLLKRRFTASRSIVGWDEHTGLFLLGGLGPAIKHLLRHSLPFGGFVPSTLGRLFPRAINALFGEKPIHGTFADIEHLADLARRGAGEIQGDDVVFVGENKFSNHVYNLETENSVYFSNTIINHNCRSTTIPFIGQSEGMRASATGPVPRTETYETWLKKQPASFQDEVLGKGKAQLFRSGEYPLDRFVDPTGREYSLRELQQLER